MSNQICTVFAIVFVVFFYGPIFGSIFIELMQDTVDMWKDFLKHDR